MDDIALVVELVVQGDVCVLADFPVNVAAVVGGEE